MVKIRVDILKKDLAAASSKARRGFARIHKESAKDILIGCVAGTRVDTGKAVSNWRVGLGAPTRSEIEAHVPGKGGSTANKNRGVTLDLGLDRINSARENQGIYISNLVEYQEFIPGFSENADMAIQRAANGVNAKRVF